MSSNDFVFLEIGARLTRGWLDNEPDAQRLDQET